MNKEQWNEVSAYDLKPGILLKLNTDLYLNMRKDALLELLRVINKGECPEYEKKLGLPRLAKIMSGQEYNTHIVHAIIDALGRK